MGGDGGMDNSAGGELDDDEDEERREEEAIRLCEVAGPDLVCVVPEEGSPILVGRRGCR